MDDDSDQTLTEDVRALVRPLVARGDRTFANILGEAVEHILDEHEGADEDTVKQVCEQETDKAFAAHLAAQAGWPEVTDCDRLDQAFEALNGRDIVALHDFTCCQTCGLAEVGAPIQAAVDAGVDVAGFTFYHAQDTDSAVDGHGLYLTYGHVDGSETNGIAIGRLVVHALNEAGLETDWTERSESASPCASTGGGAFWPRPSSVWSARRIARLTDLENTNAPEQVLRGGLLPTMIGALTPSQPPPSAGASWAIPAAGSDTRCAAPHLSANAGRRRWPRPPSAPARCRAASCS